MTTLVSWLAVDPRGPSAVYLASDSRITWGTAARRWDSGKKLFCGRSAADVFGFCGEVLFPSVVLSQLVDSIDAGLLFDEVPAPTERHQLYIQAIKHSHVQRHRGANVDFDIVHTARTSEGMAPNFRVWHTRYSSKNDTWNDEELIPQTRRSELIIALGSGAKSMLDFHKLLAASEQGGTSRAIFWAFCDSLRSGNDWRSGGAPQLSAIYREGPPKALGVYYQAMRYTVPTLNRDNP